ncbi:MAG: SPOR domain-containing protein [Aureispira sp.]
MPSNDPTVNTEVPPSSTSTATPPPIKEEPVNSWTNNSTPTNNNTPVSTPSAADVVAFKVQLGAFKDAKSINFSQLEGMGYIEQQKKSNGLTYVYLSSFKTIEDARVARTKVKDSGVAAPFIVAFKNGVQVNISEVLN